MNITKILKEHAIWLDEHEKGIRANLLGANLRGANLLEANLQGANLRVANLLGANLWAADLCGAENIPKYVENITSILPAGDIIGWKKCQNNIIVKLLIGKNTKRSCAISRKCRAEKVTVLEVFNGKIGISFFDERTEYKKGKIVKCDDWDINRWRECSNGIHFFITRWEAENYKA